MSFNKRPWSIDTEIRRPQFHGFLFRLFSYPFTYYYAMLLYAISVTFFLIAHYTVFMRIAV